MIFVQEKSPQILKEFDEVEKEVKDRIDFFMNNKGTKSVDHFHKRLGKVMWDKVGMARNEKGLKEAMAELKPFARNSGKK